MGRRRPAPMVTMITTRLRARRTVTTDLIGLSVACSSARGLGSMAGMAAASSVRGSGMGLIARDLVAVDTQDADLTVPDLQDMVDSHAGQSAKASRTVEVDSTVAAAFMEGVGSMAEAAMAAVTDKRSYKSEVLGCRLAEENSEAAGE